MFLFGEVLLLYCVYLNHVPYGVPPVLADPTISAVSLTPVGLASGRTCIVVVEVVRRHDPLESVVLPQLLKIFHI